MSVKGILIAILCVIVIGLAGLISTNVSNALDRVQDNDTTTTETAEE